MKVRIQNDGKPGYLTDITDAETGQAIEFVTRLELEISSSRKSVPSAVLYVAYPVVDVIADAEIKHVCPVCGKPGMISKREP
jgi:hypothetical protein